MTPRRMNPVPRVVMNEGTPRVTVMNPLTKPTATPMSRQRMTASSGGTP